MRLTDEELQQALGDGDIPAHFVDLLAEEVRDYRHAARALVEAEREVIATVSSGIEPGGARARGKLTAASAALRALVKGE